MSETDLTDSARQGDEAAWETLVREHQQAVFRLAYLLLADTQEAEDAAQDVFVRAFQSLDRFDASKPLRPWLMGIAANVARNRRRSIGRYMRAVRRLVQSSSSPFTTGGYERLPEWEAETLWRAVRRLNATDQEIIAMRYFLDLSEAETAAAIGIALGTAKSRQHRAIERLRVIVEREFPELQEGHGV